MDLKRLETLRSFASHGSIGRAAAQRGLTPQGVSLQLKKLEAELGAELFVRGPNRMMLTGRGEEFLREVNRAFEVLDRAKARLTEPSDEYTGTVSLSLATDIAGFFAPELAEFVQRHPKLDVKILTRPSREAKALVVDGEAQMGIGFFRKVPRGIVKKRICESGISLVYPKGHPLEKEMAPALRNIADYRVVVRRRSSATRRMIEASFAANGADLTNILEVGICQSVLNFVELGLGVGLVHTICARAEPKESLRIVDMGRYFSNTDVALITRKSALFGPAQNALMRTFTHSAAAMRLAEGHT